MTHVLVIIEDRILLKQVYALLEEFQNIAIQVCPYSMKAEKSFVHSNAELVIIDSHVFLPYDKILNNLNCYPREFKSIIIDKTKNLNLELKEQISSVLTSIQNENFENFASNSDLNDQINHFHERCEVILESLCYNNHFQAREEIQTLYSELNLNNQNVILWEFLKIQLSFFSFLFHGKTLKFNATEITEELNYVLKSELFSSIYYPSKNIQEIVGQIIKQIYKNWNQNIYIDDIAKKLNHNKDYLNRIFTEQFEISISKAIHQLNITHAKFYLLYTTKSATEISTLTGFNDNGYFTKTFKKETGFSPLLFREQKDLFLKNGIVNSTLLERNFLYESIMAIQ